MKKTFYFITFSTLLILVFLELFAHFSLKSKGISYPLFYNYSSSNFTTPWNGKHKAYSKIDPLLGWGINSNEIEALEFSTARNCIVLENGITEKKDIVVYISGGSTSDLVYDQNNWPRHLLANFEENEISAKIYVAAVGGYNSGQELLKTIQDVESIQPDFHISYAGANETEFPSYTSPYEKAFFENVLKRKRGLLPNTIEWISQLKNSAQQTLELGEVPVWEASEFWERNIKLMHAISNSNNTIFLSILQPVKGQDEALRYFEQVNVETAHLVSDYKAFYPIAKEITKNYSFVYDFTKIFSTQGADVYKDDCHIALPIHQQMISEAIFNLIDSMIVRTVEDGLVLPKP